MANISATLVRELREATSAGMMDCKKALTECDGDMEAAKEWLRKKGLSAASKRAGNTAKEGVIGLSSDADNKATLIEINCQTDFVARNPDFQDRAKTLSSIAHEAETTEAMLDMPFPATSHAVKDELQQLVAVIGENIQLRRKATLSVDQGVVATYLHNTVVDGLGKIGVLVALSSSADASKLHEIGKRIAMHVAAAKPTAVNRDAVDSSMLDKEREIFAEQARASGKPEQVIEKIVDGRIQKFYKEITLLEQPFVMNPDQSVAQMVEEAAKELGAPIEVLAFERFEVGEGIEAEESDFAAEVAAMSKTQS